MCALSGAAELSNPAMFFSHLLRAVSPSSVDTFLSRAFCQVCHCHPKLLFCFYRELPRSELGVDVALDTHSRRLPR
jgi:hypothetical protein